MRVPTLKNVRSADSGSLIPESSFLSRRVRTSSPVPLPQIAD
jgi:hypothetical protein